MTDEQEAVAQLLRKALKQCRDTGLGVYIFDASVAVFPIKHGSPLDYENAFEAISAFGLLVGPVGLRCDGGAGV